MQESIIREHYKSAVAQYPQLRKPYQDEGVWSIYGRIDIVDLEGNNWDTYEVKIVFPLNYPQDLPILFEVGGKIKRDKEWHINVSGSCCLGPPVKLLIDLAGRITLVDWLDKHAVPFLANHFLKDKTDHYAGEEYSHGHKGILEFYQQWWNQEDAQEILLKLGKITKKIKIGRNKPCFCESGKNYKECHLFSKDYLGVPIKFFEEDYASIRALTNLKNGSRLNNHI